MYVYTVSTISDMANFSICICVTDFVYFQMLYNHCGYTIPGVVTGNGCQGFESVRFGNPVCAGHTGLLIYASSDTSVIISCNCGTKKPTY